MSQKNIPVHVLQLLGKLQPGSKEEAIRGIGRYGYTSTHLGLAKLMWNNLSADARRYWLACSPFDTSVLEGDDDA